MSGTEGVMELALILEIPGYTQFLSLLQGTEGVKELALILEIPSTYPMITSVSSNYVRNGRNGPAKFDSRDPNYKTYDNFLPLFLNYVKKRRGWRGQL